MTASTTIKYDVPKLKCQYNGKAKVFDTSVQFLHRKLIFN